MTRRPVVSSLHAAAHKTRDAAARVAARAWAIADRCRPGRPPLFVVGSFAEVTEGNALEFARTATRDPRVRCVLVVPTFTEAARLAGLGLAATARGSHRERALLARADAVFTTGHLQSDFGGEPRASALRVMLWHATPMKGVGRLCRPVPDPIGDYDLVVATSPFTAGIMRDAFGGAATRVAITGHPKSDPLMQPGAPAPAIESLRVTPRTRVISYLPTWRHDFDARFGGDFGQDAGPLLRVVRDLAGDAGFRGLLEEADAVFAVKPHALDDLARLRELQRALPQRMRLLEPAGYDTGALLRSSAIVVTDYSGVLTDWLLLARPTVCFTYDYDEYWRHRGNPSFDYRETFRRLMVQDLPALIERVRAFLAEPTFLGSEIRRVRQLLHAHTDGRASERIIDAALAALRDRPPVRSCAAPTPVSLPS
jgi:CDP-glycerol glycerophosphotransferase